MCEGECESACVCVRGGEKCVEGRSTTVSVHEVLNITTVCKRKTRSPWRPQIHYQPCGNSKDGKTNNQLTPLPQPKQTGSTCHTHSNTALQEYMCHTCTCTCTYMWLKSRLCRGLSVWPGTDILGHTVATNQIKSYNII